jgi:hypothetical protein
MDFATLQDNVTTWVGGLATGRDGSAVPVEWGKMPQKVQIQPFILAYLGAIIPRGSDEYTYAYDSLTDELEESMYGVREATFHLSFRNFDQRLGYSARYYAERFRIRTQSTYGKESLPDPLGLIRTGELIETDYEWSGRLINQVDMDVVLSFWMDLVEPDYGGGYIKSVNIEGQAPIVDEWGNPIMDENGVPVVAEDAITINVVTE